MPSCNFGFLFRAVKILHYCCHKVLFGRKQSLRITFSSLFLLEHALYNCLVVDEYVLNHISYLSITPSIYPSIYLCIHLSLSKSPVLTFTRSSSHPPPPRLHSPSLLLKRDEKKGRGWTGRRRRRGRKRRRERRWTGGNQENRPEREWRKEGGE